MPKKKYTTVSIPRPLYEKVRRIIAGTGFTSVSDYVTYVLREVLAAVEEEKGSVFNRKKERKIIEKLRALGYV
ncbi:MAG: CopG family transcriptional regulator [Thermoprotei archaeon]|nr:MAG: CopG family transcriptional regulator [Thermoprotei archaeon]